MLYVSLLTVVFKHTILGDCRRNKKTNFFILIMQEYCKKSCSRQDFLVNHKLVAVYRFITVTSGLDPQDCLINAHI